MVLDGEGGHINLAQMLVKRISMQACELHINLQGVKEQIE